MISHYRNRIVKYLNINNNKTHLDDLFQLYVILSMWCCWLCVPRRVWLPTSFEYRAATRVWTKIGFSFSLLTVFYGNTFFILIEWLIFIILCLGGFFKIPMKNVFQMEIINIISAGPIKWHTIPFNRKRYPKKVCRPHTIAFSFGKRFSPNITSTRSHISPHRLQLDSSKNIVTGNCGAKGLIESVGWHKRTVVNERDQSVTNIMTSNLFWLLLHRINTKKTSMPISKWAIDFWSIHTKIHTIMIFPLIFSIWVRKIQIKMIFPLKNIIRHENAVASIHCRIKWCMYAYDECWIFVHDLLVFHGMAIWTGNGGSSDVHSTLIHSCSAESIVDQSPSTTSLINQFAWDYLLMVVRVTNLWSMNNFICFVLDRRTRIRLTYAEKCSVIRCNSLNKARSLCYIYNGLKGWGWVQDFLWLAPC